MGRIEKVVAFLGFRRPLFQVVRSCCAEACCRVLQEFGGRILPANRSEQSLRLIQQLKDEAVAPLWPDPEVNATEAASNAVPVRSPFAILPCLT